MDSLYLQTACKHPSGLTLDENVKSDWNSNANGAAHETEKIVCFKVQRSSVAV